MSGDDHLRCLVRPQSAHGSQPVFELAVVSLDRIVGVLLDVMPSRRINSSSTPGYTAAASVTTSLGVTFNADSARRKNLSGSNTQFGYAACEYSLIRPPGTGRRRT